MDDARPTPRFNKAVEELTESELEQLLLARRATQTALPSVQEQPADKEPVKTEHEYVQAPGIDVVQDVDNAPPAEEDERVDLDKSNTVEKPPVYQEAPAPAPAAPVTVKGIVDDSLDQSTPADEFPIINERPVANNPAVKTMPEFSAPRDDRNSVLRSSPSLSTVTANLDAVAVEVASMMEGVQIDQQTGERLYKSQEQEMYGETLANASFMHAPVYSNGATAQVHAMTEEGTTWDQRLMLPAGDQLALVRDHSKQDTSLRGKIRSSRAGGRPITIFLPKSNIYVSFTSPVERDFVDFDMELAQKTASIGWSTFGLLLSASSGVYVRSMVDFALRFVTAISVDCAGNDMKTVLYNTVAEEDAWLLYIGVLIAKYPQGLPWRLACPVGKCMHEEPTTLNLARCIRVGNGLFTDAQLAQIARQRGKIVSAIDLADYKAAMAVPKHNTFEHSNGDDTLIVEWGSCTIGEYFDYVDSWVGQNNDLATAALSENATEAEREYYLRNAAETRRLMRHRHKVRAITRIDSDGTVERTEDGKEIDGILEDMSGDRQYVLAFENAISRYIEESRMAVFGYMAKPCPSCGNPAGEADGVYRGIVSISPDRVFFTVSRVVSEIQRALADQFGGIG